MDIQDTHHSIFGFMIRIVFFFFLMLFPAANTLATEQVRSVDYFLKHSQEARLTLLHCAVDATRITLSMGVTSRAKISGYVRHYLMQEKTCRNAAGAFYDLKREGEVESLGVEEIYVGLDAGYGYLQKPQEARAKMLQCIVDANRMAVDEHQQDLAAIKKRAEMIFFTRERCISAASAVSYFESTGKIKKIRLEEIVETIKKSRIQQ
ncbi:hypothetical protein JWG39_06885 [Desulforhopalus vacuolatus]|uniref:hypothetical protein n=1 Tax=Desulforhopalus vacuolatus TaxID=40414 RepID=UPI00196564FA|nr:hypothetical protein [Desulforhopalus vacuolatus]MBM9519544.1 hypothetical protein [Desulforhopalus vacuolatus]